MALRKWILGGLGFVLGGPIGALIGVLIASVFDVKSFVYDEVERNKRSSQEVIKNLWHRAEALCHFVLEYSCHMKKEGG